MSFSPLYTHPLLSQTGIFPLVWSPVLFANSGLSKGCDAREGGSGAGRGVGRLSLRALSLPPAAGQPCVLHPQHQRELKAHPPPHPGLACLSQALLVAARLKGENGHWRFYLHFHDWRGALGVQAARRQGAEAALASREGRTKRGVLSC